VQLNASVAEGFATGGTVPKGRMIGGMQEALASVSPQFLRPMLGSMDGAALPVGRRKA